MPVRHRGRVEPANIDHLIDLSHQRHGNRLRALAKLATPDAWDSWTKNWIGAIKDQSQCGSCFPAGTLVRIADGSHKPIEQVTTTDSVLTAEGNVRRVSHTMRRHAKEPLLTLVMWGHYHLRATAEHPVLTKRGYVKLAEMQPGDWVAFPRYAPETTTMIQTADYIFGRNHGKNAAYAHRGWSEEQHREREQSVSGRKKIVTRTSVLPDVIQLTHGFGRLAGLYLAEGSTDRARVRWTFNIREKDTFAAEVVALAKSELGAEAHIAERPNNTVWVTVYGARMARLFEALFAQGAGSKRLHPDLASGPKDFLRGVLTGWMDGDKHKEGSAVSISRRLALSMFDIANALGMMPALSTHQKGKVGKDGILREHAWRVDTNDPQIYKRGAAVMDDTHMWRKVCEVTEEPFDGDVFNLEVEGDHSYTAEGVGVHNCWDFSGTRVVETTYNVAGLGGGKDQMILSEEYTLDCGNNGGCDGDDNTTVLDWAKATGLPLTADYGPYTAGSGHTGRCAYKQGMKLWKIDDWGFADQSGGKGVTDTDMAKQAIMTYGGVGCAIAADNDFEAWGDNNPSASKPFTGSGSRDIDHDVFLSGWQDTGSKLTAYLSANIARSTAVGFWWLDNSWGKGWGIGGRMAIAYGANLVGTECVFALIKNPNPPGPAPIDPDLWC